MPMLHLDRQKQLRDYEGRHCPCCMFAHQNAAIVNNHQMLKHTLANITKRTDSEIDTFLSVEKLNQNGEKPQDSDSTGFSILNEPQPRHKYT